MNINNIIRIRMERLGFAIPAQTEKDYDGIFKRLQPVPTDYFSEPGRPPSLRDRALFDDVEYNRLLRENQDIIKARFQGNTISYVLRDEFEMYASAFCKPLSRADETMMELYNVLGQVGPMDKKQLMEEMDMKGPAVTKILQKLQKAFLIYELQPDRFGEQVWQTFDSEWPEFVVDRFSKDDARRMVVKRFIRNMVVADGVMVRDWTRFSKRDTSELLAGMIDSGDLDAVENNGIAEYFLPEDKGNVFNRMAAAIPAGIFVIHKADYLYRAYESVLKERYKGREVLQFLLIDGVFQGAVEGHWRISPHNVENIHVELPEAEAAARRDEIITAVSRFYKPPYSKILRYNDVPVE